MSSSETSGLAPDSSEERKFPLATEGLGVVSQNYLVWLVVPLPPAVQVLCQFEESFLLDALVHHGLLKNALVSQRGPRCAGWNTQGSEGAL